MDAKELRKFSQGIRGRHYASTWIGKKGTPPSVLNHVGARRGTWFWCFSASGRAQQAHAMVQFRTFATDYITLLGPKVIYLALSLFFLGPHGVSSLILAYFFP